MTIRDLQAQVIGQLRQVRLAEKQLRAVALGYDAGEIDVADLVLASVRYAATVRVYRDTEAVLLDLGIRVPKAVRDGVSTEVDWDPEIDVETQPCAVRRSTTLQ